MNYIMSPVQLLDRAKNIEGFNTFQEQSSLQGYQLVDTAISVAEDWTETWPEGQGFGSSDGTSMVQDFINTLIGLADMYGQYETKYTPSLSVVEYSEEDHDNSELAREQGG